MKTQWVTRADWSGDPKVAVVERATALQEELYVNDDDGIYGTIWHEDKRWWACAQEPALYSEVWDITEADRVGPYASRDEAKAMVEMFCSINGLVDEGGEAT